MPTTIDKPSTVKHSAKDNKPAGSGDAVQPDGKAQKPAAPLRIKPLDIVVPDEINRYTIGGKIGSGV